MCWKKHIIEKHFIDLSPTNDALSISENGISFEVKIKMISKNSCLSSHLWSETLQKVRCESGSQRTFAFLGSADGAIRVGGSHRSGRCPAAGRQCPGGHCHPQPPWRSNGGGKRLRRCDRDIHRERLLLRRGEPMVVGSIL